MPSLNDDLEFLQVLCWLAGVALAYRYWRILKLWTSQPRAMPFKAPGVPQERLQPQKGPGSRLVYLGRLQGPAMPFGAHVTLVDADPDLEAMGVREEDRGVKWFHVRTERGQDFLARADLCQ